MKILVIGLEGSAADVWLQDERLTTLRGLMEAGCYGPLEGAGSPTSPPSWTCLATSRPIQAPAIWDRVAAANGRSILIDLPAGVAPQPAAGLSIVATGATGASSDDGADSLLDASRKRFEAVRRLMTEESWDYMQVVDDGIDRLRLDQEIARTLELLGDDAIVLIAFLHPDPTTRGAFILAGTQLPPFGAIDGVRVLDVAPTLLALADLPPPPQADGRDFLEGREPTDPAGGVPGLDDDELVRERLRGLGYIG